MRRPLQPKKGPKFGEPSEVEWLGINLLQLIGPTGIYNADPLCRTLGPSFVLMTLY